MSHCLSKNLVVILNIAVINMNEREEVQIDINIPHRNVTPPTHCQVVFDHQITELQICIHLNIFLVLTYMDFWALYSLMYMCNTPVNRWPFVNNKKSLNLI